MPTIYPQEFYLTDQLVEDSIRLSGGFKNRKRKTLLHKPISIEHKSDHTHQKKSMSLHRFNKPRLLVYEFESNKKKCHGILCCLNVTDFQKGNITKHEGIYHEKVREIEKQYQNTSVKAEPIVVTFEDNEKIDSLISDVTDRNPDFLTIVNNQHHKFWLIDDDTTKVLQYCFDEISLFHLVDGHHRTTAIENLKIKKSKSNKIFCFLIGLKQIELNSFIWNIETPLTEFESKELEGILNCFNTQKTQSIEPPSKRFPLIFYWKNNYYKFHQESISDCIIPQFIQHEFFNKIPASINWKKEYIPYSEHCIESKTANSSMSFLMQSLTKDQLIDIASRGELLPQKSTYALPKLTQNLVLSPF